MARRRRNVVARRMEWEVAGWIVKVLLSPILIPLWILRKLI